MHTFSNVFTSYSYKANLTNSLNVLN